MKMFRFGGALLAVLTTACAQVILAPPQNQSVAAGATAMFSVGASGSGLSYAWQKNGTAIAGASSATLTIANVQPAAAGIYTVTITGATTSTTASAILGLISSTKVLGSAEELWA